MRYNYRVQFYRLTKHYYAKQFTETNPLKLQNEYVVEKEDLNRKVACMYIVVQSFFNNA